jgi:hypothetical protein
MAELKLANLVLRGVRAVNPGVATVLERNGATQAGWETASISLSFSRHLPPGHPDDMQPAVRSEHATPYEVARAAQRAGRSGSSAGVLGSRGLARSARTAILSGWPCVTGGKRFAGTCRGTVTATATPAGSRLPGYPQSFGSVAGRSAVRLAISRPHTAGKGTGAGWALIRTLQGMRSTSA